MVEVSSVSKPSPLYPEVVLYLGRLTLFTRPYLQDNVATVFFSIG